MPIDICVPVDSTKTNERRLENRSYFLRSATPALTFQDYRLAVFVHSAIGPRAVLFKLLFARVKNMYISDSSSKPKSIGRTELF